MADKSTIDQHYAKETRAWEMLCERLGRDPQTSEESDTCTLRAAWKAMMAFSAQEAASPTLLEACQKLDAFWLENFEPPHPDPEKQEPRFLTKQTLDVWRTIRAAITLATGEPK